MGGKRVLVIHWIDFFRQSDVRMMKVLTRLDKLHEKVEAAFNGSVIIWGRGFAQSPIQPMSSVRARFVLQQAITRPSSLCVCLVPVFVCPAACWEALSLLRLAASRPTRIAFCPHCLLFTPCRRSAVAPSQHGMSLERPLTSLLAWRLSWEGKFYSASISHNMWSVNRRNYGQINVRCAGGQFVG